MDLWCVLTIIAVDLFFFIGILWPLQSLPEWVVHVSYCLPIAVPVKAARAIMLKGIYRFELN